MTSHNIQDSLVQITIMFWTWIWIKDNTTYSKPRRKPSRSNTDWKILGKTPDISEYIDFQFYKCAALKEDVRRTWRDSAWKIIRGGLWCRIINVVLNAASEWYDRSSHHRTKIDGTRITGGCNSRKDDCLQQKN